MIPLPNITLVKNINYTPEENDEWILKTISKDPLTVGINGINDFQVYTLIKNNKVLMKPAGLVFTSEFERLFDFGCGCYNYNPNKIITVTDPNYINHFI